VAFDVLGMGAGGDHQGLLRCVGDREF